MRKIILMAAIAGLLATTQRGFADPLPMSAPDHVQTATSGTETTPQAPAWASSSDATAPAANTDAGKSGVPVGFGWG